MPHKTSQMPKSPLRLWREATGVSIRELEKRTGIHRARLSMYELAGNAPAPDLQLIRAALSDPEPVSITPEEAIA